MKLLSKIVLWIVGVLFWSRPAVAFWTWIANHKLPVCVFGGLLSVILIVGLNAGLHGDGELAKHVFNRQFSVHIGLGGLLYALFSWLLITLEHRKRDLYDWRVFYFAPLVCLLAINCTNEWAFALTPPPPYCAELTDAGTPCGYLGGDDARARLKGDTALGLKSIADICGWAFGALAIAWWIYRGGERMGIATQQRVRHRDRKRRERR